MTPLAVQCALIALNYSLGPAGADGVWGRASIAALRLFQGDHGLRVDGVAGPVTYAALASATGKPTPASDIPATAVWYVEAGRLMGVRETAGAQSSAVILGWARALGGWVAGVYRDDATPWCGLFVAHCLGATLPEEPLPGNPLSALAWGKFGVPLARPQLGAVCVFRRKGGGHVGFYAGEDAAAVHVRGGNQSDAVTVARVAKARLVGYRWPATVPLPAGAAPRVLEARGNLSANEA